MKPRVVVGMSGGVDSSVAAALLKQQGYEVIGMMLHLWCEPGEDDENKCCTPESAALAKRVAGKLDIPFYLVDAEGKFYDDVVNPFLDSYSSGETPNPCIACNRYVRWAFMLARAKAMGASYLATGHYARIGEKEGGSASLLRGKDRNKDQSYFLSLLTQDQLQHTLLPLGNFLKPEIRDMARTMQLEVADRKDSQDLCFLGRRDLRSFLAKHRPETLKPGPIINQRGEVLGEHQGLAFYTIGQRKGLGIAMPQPHYVIHKDMRKNTLVIDEKDKLGSDHLRAGRMNWLTGSPPAQSFDADVKIRYRSRMVKAQIRVLEDGGTADVKFEENLRDITPGQVAAIYIGEEVIGAGFIQPGDEWIDGEDERG